MVLCKFIVQRVIYILAWENNSTKNSDNNLVQIRYIINTFGYIYELSLNTVPSGV
jgi:hypothetical protein